MAELTTGYVAGLIAVCVIIAQFFFPTAITFFLAGHLSDQATAATWTVASRALQSSYWPLLLQTDSTRNNGVRRSVIWIALVIPCLAVLVSIAGIVTPMGLYERDEVSDDLSHGAFEYAKDSSAFLLGTSTRTDRSFNRLCNYASMAGPCPYSGDEMVYSWNGSTISASYPNGLNLTVPQVLHDIYMSGTKNRKTTVSSYFDIEWRQLTVQYMINYNNGSALPAGFYRYLESVLLNDDFRAVEGLVVDTKSGGVGFRNHTLPTGKSKGATWSEDLLFLVPDVECVDMNLTTDFQVTTGSNGYSSRFALAQLNMTDRGGFVNLSTVNPLNQSHNMADHPNVPDLKKRAYKAAWFTNLLNMYVMNLTDITDAEKGTKRQQRVDSKMNQQFKIPISSSPAAVQGVQITSDFGSPLGVTLISDDDDMFPNPFNVTSEAYDEGLDVCQGWRYNGNLTRLYRNKATTINNTYVQCLLVQGAPERTDDGPANVFEHESRWTSPMYMCASAVKATIKTVTFFHNGSSENLDNLVIKDIQDKNYTKDSDLPLWGVEDWALDLDDFNAIWGLVDSSLEGFQNITTLRSASLYLLGIASALTSLDVNYPMRNLPGTLAPFAALSSIISSSSSDYGATDYSGRGSMGVWMKWKQLSKSADTTSDIIKLLWTDIMASAVVGTKGALGARNMEPDQAANIAIQETVRKVKYRWEFGVPAFLVLLFLVLIGALLLLSVVFGQSHIDMIRQRLNQVSLGRVLTTIYFPDSSSFVMPSDVWNRANGDKVMDMTRGGPVMETSEDVHYMAEDTQYQGGGQYMQEDTQYQGGVQYMQGDGQFTQVHFQYPQGDIQYVQQGNGEYIPVQVHDQMPGDHVKS